MTNFFQRNRRSVARRVRPQASAVAKPRTGALHGFVALCTAFCLAFSLLSVAAPAALAAATSGTTDHVADASTVDSWSSVLGTAADGTRNAGNIWTDKSISVDGFDFSDEVAGDGAFTNKDGDFLATYSALGSTSVINGEVSQPIDMMLVLDMSGSMGKKRDGKPGTDGMTSMIPAINEFMDDFLAASEHNRIGLVAYDSTAYVLLPLDHYTKQADSKNYVTAEDHHYQYWGDTLNKDTDQVASVLRTHVVTSKGDKLNNEVTSWTNTNTQAGIVAAMDQLAQVEKTTVKLENNREITRVPAMILLTDGAANTVIASDWNATGDELRGESRAFDGSTESPYPSAQAGSAGAGKFSYIGDFKGDNTTTPQPDKPGLTVYGAGDDHVNVNSNALTLSKTLMSAALWKSRVEDHYNAGNTGDKVSMDVRTIAYNLAITTNSDLGYFYGVTYGAINPLDYYTKNLDVLSGIPNKDNGDGKELYSADVIFNDDARDFKWPADGEIDVFNSNEAAVEALNKAQGATGKAAEIDAPGEPAAHDAADNPSDESDATNEPTDHDATDNPSADGEATNEPADEGEPLAADEPQEAIEKDAPRALTRSTLPGAYQIIEHWLGGFAVTLRHGGATFALKGSDADRAAVREHIKYNDKFYVATTEGISNDLKDIFRELAGETNHPVTDSVESASNDGLVYTDVIGDYMEVKNVEALLLFGERYDIEQVSTDGEMTQWAVSLRVGQPDEVTNDATGMSFNLSDIKISSKKETTARDDGTVTVSEVFTVAVPEEAVPLITDTVQLPRKSDPAGHSATITRSGATPLRVIYSIGVAEEVKLADGSVDLTKITPEYKAANTDGEGHLKFYSNTFEANSDDDATPTKGTATAVFNPSGGNGAYYFQYANTLYTKYNGNWEDGKGERYDDLDVALGTLENPASGDLADDQDYYYLVRYYVPTGEPNDKGEAPARLVYEVVKHRGDELQGSVQGTTRAGEVSTIEGSPRAGVLNALAAEKGEGKKTDTADYVSLSSYSANDVEGTETNVTTALGNNGELRVSVPALAIEKDQALGDGALTKDVLTAELEDTVTYQLTVTNPSTQQVTGAVITDEIPGDLQLVENSIAGTVRVEGSEDREVSGTHSNGVITWNVGTMEPGAVATLTFQAVVPAGTTADEWVNQGSATFANNPEGADKPVTSNEVKIVRGKPVVTVVKAQAIAEGEMTTDKLPVKTDNEITYQLTVANGGDIPARDVLVRDQIPAGLTLVEGSASDGGTISGNTVSWTLSTLGAGEKRALSVKVKVPKVTVATQWTNVAAVSFANNPEGPDAEVKSNSVVADIAVEKSPASGSNESTKGTPKDKLAQTGDSLFPILSALFGAMAVGGIGLIVAGRRAGKHGQHAR